MYSEINNYLIKSKTQIESTEIIITDFYINTTITPKANQENIEICTIGNVIFLRKISSF